MISPSQAIQKGVILLNLGTPALPHPPEVRNYLKEFLMDPYVLDIPFFIRWALVHGIILPKRPKVSAAAYQKIWTERGSPLLVHLLDLVEKVAKNLGQSWLVQPAMRYGSPSIDLALRNFAKHSINDILIVPLYPQYSLAATESSIQECLRLAKKILPGKIRIQFIESFFEFNLFIEAFSKIIHSHLKEFDFDYLLFSFHGLPERQIKKTDSSGNHCLVQQECCFQKEAGNPYCYRAQCMATARLIGEKLGIPTSQYGISFQSRLGRTPWIQPYTDHYLKELPKKGIKNLAIACPAFVADCLETLEEIEIRGRNDFINHGGNDLKLIPSLNSSDLWADAVTQLIQNPSEVHCRLESENDA